jgi:23S rRNA U2552 (ribose-2'-O)-methylase RlmE/FtsJ
MVKMQQVVRELSGSVTDYAKVDLSQSQALPKSQCIAFDIHYEETMDLLKEKIRDHELVLKLVEDYENHYEV